MFHLYGNKKEEFLSSGQIQLVDLNSTEESTDVYLGSKDVTLCHNMLILAKDSDGNSKYAILGHFNPVNGTEDAQKRLSAFIEKHSAELTGLNFTAMVVGGKGWTLQSLRLDDVADRMGIEFKQFKSLDNDRRAFDFVWKPLEDELCYKTDRDKEETIKLGFTEEKNVKSGPKKK